MAGVKGCFDRCQGKGAAVGDFECPFAGFGLQVGSGDDAVDQTPVERLLRGDLGVGIPDFLGALLADEVFQVPRAVACIEAADHGANLAEHGGIGRDRDIADHLQDVAAAYCHAVY